MNRLLTIVARAIESGGFDCSGGTLWTQRLRESGLTLAEFISEDTRAVGPPSAESADAPHESGLVGQSAVTVSD